MKHPKKRNAFTLVELLVVISIIALLVGLLLPALGRAKRTAQQVKCGAQLRGIHQGLVGWSSDNDDSYPIPERLDKNDWTEPNSANKNRTGNVMSVLIFGQVISPDLCISPGEASAEIQTPIESSQLTQYNFRFTSQSANGVVENSEHALYDPRFKGSPLDHEANNNHINWEDSELNQQVGHNSYAHTPITWRATRTQDMWGSSQANARQAIMSNRGPTYDELDLQDPSEWELTKDEYGEQSLSLEIHGSRKSWAGNVLFNDSHVDFFTNPNPESIQIWWAGEESTIRDNIFHDEQQEEDPYASDSPFQNDWNRRNAYLRIWKQGIPDDAADFSSVYIGDPGSPYIYVDGQIEGD
jgi:prepilin-type N-terminal cleavage/methylation domain-containing protein